MPTPATPDGSSIGHLSQAELPLCYDIEFNRGQGWSALSPTVAAEDPGTGSITSLARPGGNITGLITINIINIELSGKQRALLKEALPKLSRVALLRNPDNPIQAVNAKVLPRPDISAMLRRCRRSPIVVGYVNE